jgi:hypothetical protein
MIQTMGELRATARMPGNQMGRSRSSPALMARKPADSARGNGIKRGWNERNYKEGKEKTFGMIWRELH